jgi:small subunit ribosomal protein S6
MALYEITFLTREESDPGVRAAIEEAGGTIEAESSMGRRRLAYPILKETQAVYTSFVFSAPTTAIAVIDRKFRLNTGIMRHLIVTKALPQADKSVTKTVREAIEAAEKLEDAADVKEEPKAPVAAAPAPVEEVVAEVAEPLIETVAEAAPAEALVVETETEDADTLDLEANDETTKETPVAEEKPARKPRAKKVEDAASATEEDRLKALEDKLGEILKD